MGIINLTPDSFSDGGDFCSIENVLNQINYFVSNGVDVIDLGAQSTRPGALEIGAKNESKRLIPYLKKIRSCLLYTSPSPRDESTSRMPSSA